MFRKKGKCLESVASDLKDIMEALCSDIEEIIVDNMTNGEIKSDLADEDLYYLDAIYTVLDKMYDMKPEIEALKHIKE